MFRKNRGPRLSSAPPSVCVVALALVLAAPLTSRSQSPATNNRALPAPGAAPGASTARIQFAAPVYDFGKVTVGEVVKHDFAFTNTGTETLVITEVQTTCGCASIGTTSRRVEPGKAGSLPIEFHTDAFDGPVTKTLTVVCNDAQQPKVTLEVKGVVWRPLVAIPPNAPFVGALDSLASFSKVIVITNREPEPLVLFAPETSHRAIAAELKTNRFGQEYELTVRLVPPLGSGNLFGEARVKTSFARMPLLTIPVWVVPQPAVLVLPPELVLPVGPLTNQLTQTVVIRNNSTDPLVLRQPAVDAAGVNLEMTELEAGRHFAARLTFPRGFQIPAGTNAQLTMQSSNPKFPVIRVPIVQR